MAIYKTALIDSLLCYCIVISYDQRIINTYILRIVSLWLHMFHNLTCFLDIHVANRYVNMCNIFLYGF